MAQNDVSLRLKLASEQIARDAAEANAVLKGQFDSVEFDVRVNVDGAADQLRDLQAQVLNAQASLADPAEALALRENAALLQEGLRYKKQLAEIQGAGLTEADAAAARKLAANLNALNVQRIERGFADARRELSGLEGGLKRFFREFNQGSNNLFAGLAQGVGQGLTDAAFGAVQGIGGFIGEGIATGSQAEQIGIAFETMTGSAEKGQQALQDLIDFAATTPFELPGIQNAGKQLLASALSLRSCQRP